ncbi:MAG: hypothetical protein JXA23_07075 [Bacteroidales bacterium]|nr:hypothetical protein [Bacteroidales bacterium]
MKRITTRSVVFLVILSLMGLLVTNALYLHTHKLPDGTMVIHAHPFNKTQDPSPVKQHQHSSVEFITLSHLQILFCIALILVFLADRPGSSRMIFRQIEPPENLSFREFPVTRPPPSPIR